MKLFEKIRAIFNFKGQRAEMTLKSAEIRGNKVFLHPADDPKHTFCISGKAVDILIDSAVELTEDDFIVLYNEKMSKLQPAIDVDPSDPIEKHLQPKRSPDEKKTQKEKEPRHNSPEAKIESDAGSKSAPKDDSIAKEKKGAEQQSDPKANVSYSQYMPKMRTVSMRLYQEEYDMLMESISANGYKKTEYLLACVAAAKKKSMQTAYQKYYAEHQQRRKADREAAKRAAEEQMNLENQIGA